MHANAKGTAEAGTTVKKQDINVLPDVNETPTDIEDIPDTGSDTDPGTQSGTETDPGTDQPGTETPEESNPEILVDPAQVEEQIGSPIEEIPIETTHDPETGEGIFDETCFTEKVGAHIVRIESFIKELEHSCPIAETAQLKAWTESIHIAGDIDAQLAAIDYHTVEKIGKEKLVSHVDRLSHKIISEISTEDHPLDNLVRKIQKLETLIQENKFSQAEKKTQEVIDQIALKIDAYLLKVEDAPEGIEVNYVKKLRYELYLNKLQTVFRITDQCLPVNWCAIIEPFSNDPRLHLEELPKVTDTSKKTVYRIEPTDLDHGVIATFFIRQDITKSDKKYKQKMITISEEGQELLSYTFCNNLEEIHHVLSSNGQKYVYESTESCPQYVFVAVAVVKDCETIKFVLSIKFQGSNKTETAVIDAHIPDLTKNLKIQTVNHKQEASVVHVKAFRNYIHSPENLNEAYYQGDLPAEVGVCSDLKECGPCTSGCEICTPHDCDKCEHPNKYNEITGLCEPTCPDGTFLGKRERCKPCDETCGTCDGKNPDDCKSCEEDMEGIPYVLDDGKCVPHCPDDKMPVTNEDGVEECEPCSDDDSCQKCDQDSEPEDPKCKKCRPGRGFVLDPITGKCVKKCPPGFVKKHGVCVACEANCHTCSSDTDCDKCDEENGFKIKDPDAPEGDCVKECEEDEYVDIVDGVEVCTKCGEHCTGCNDEGGCTSCDDESFKHNDECKDLCTDGTVKVDGVCHPCGVPGCKRCPADNFAEDCNKCEDNNEVVLKAEDSDKPNATKDECVETCPDGTRKGNRKCQPCKVEHCKVCDDNRNTCEECVDGYHVLTGDSCVPTCPHGMTDIDGDCVDCDDESNCKRCNPEDTSICESCIDDEDHILYEGKCIPECPEGTYKANNTCYPCLENCKICDNESKCDTCEDGTIPQDENTKCVPECEEGHTYDEELEECVSCEDENCKKCDSESTSVCDECDEGYKREDGTCVKHCETGTYPDDDDVCQPCGENCKKCDEDGCKKCKGDKILHNGKCLTHCPDKMTFVEIVKDCEPCNEEDNCLKCDGTDSGHCTDCEEGERLEDGKCVTECKEGNFAFDPPADSDEVDSCEPCIEPCELCTGVDSCTQCESDSGAELVDGKCVDPCEDGSVRTADGECEPCLDNDCKTCDPNDLEKCTECKEEDGKIKLDNGDCKYVCPDGTLEVMPDRCEDCKVDKCEECESRNTCEKCEEGYLVVYKEKKDKYFCEKKCPNGEYPEDDIRCKPCQVDNCDDCPSADTCDGCEEGYLLDESDGKCKTKCDDGTYEENEESCKKCDDSCATCENAEECTGCKDTEVLENGECKGECSDGYVEVDGECEKCTDFDECKVCKKNNKDKCKKCKDGYFLKDEKCVDDCGNEYRENEEKKTCDPCIGGCKICDSDPDSCDVCKNGKKLDGTSCDDTCSDGSTPVNTKFTDDDGIEHTHKVCEPCDVENCKDCPNQAKCKECDKDMDGTDLYVVKTKETQEDGTVKIIITCEKCKTGTYPKGHKCHNCTKHCEECDNDETCDKCEEGFVLNPETLKCEDHCPDGHVEMEDGTCKKCQTATTNEEGEEVDNCKNCTQEDQTKCDECEEGFILDNGECIIHCPDGTVMVDGVCEDCEEHCELCYSEEECKECEEGYVLFEGECIPDEECEVAEGQYKKDGECIDCPENCKVCDEEGCLECEDEHYEAGDECVDECDPGFFPDENGVCTKCIKHCNKCDNTETCDVCNDGYRTNAKETKCVPDCEDGEGNDRDDQQKCKPCTDPHCKKCRRNNEVCKECDEGYVLEDGECKKNCDADQYLDEDTGSCKPCHETCATCTNGDSCDNCKPNEQLQNGECTPTCEDGTLPVDGVCESCTVEYCKICVGGVLVDDEISDHCKECIPPRKLKNGECELECDDDQYIKETPNGEKCKDCPSTCTECTKATNCTGCKEDYELKDGECVPEECEEGEYKDPDTKECKPCNNSEDCKTCDSNGDCTKCKEEGKVVTPDDECKYQCPDGTFKDNEADKCDNCPDNCKRCNDEDECKECESPLVLRQDGTCQHSCPDGDYKKNGKCKDCKDKLCKKCLENGEPCTECIDGYKLMTYEDGETVRTECKPACDEGHVDYHEDGTCEKCETGCKLCKTPTNCEQCYDDFLLDGNDCVTECEEEGYVEVHGECKECKQDNCDKCKKHDQEFCKDCSEGFVSVDGRCEPACPGQMYPDYDDRCKPCPENCKSCNDANDCTDCYEPKVLKDGECVEEECPDHTVEIDGECIDCTDEEHCLKCYPSDPDRCKKCDDGTALRDDGTCGEECDSDQFKNDAGECVDCLLNCAKCDNAETCENCKGEFDLNPEKTKCEDGCDDGKVKIDGECVDCSDPDNCIKCNPDNVEICDQCIEGQVVGPDGECTSECPLGYMIGDERCDPCIGGCELCPENFDECEKCDPDHALEGDECYDKCPDGKMKNEDGECESCKDTECKKCDDDKDYCETCSDGTVNNDGSCDESCDDDEYVDEENNCQPCHETCETCINGDACTSCESPKVLDNGECKDSCPPRKRNVDGKCEPCKRNCYSCLPDLKTCTSCDPTSPDYDHLRDGKCKDKCKKDQYMVEVPNPFYDEEDEESDEPPTVFVCEPCNGDCEKCKDLDHCDKCKPNFKRNPETGECENECEDGHVKDGDECVPCDDKDNCIKCENQHANTCIDCKDPLVEKDGKCVPTCEDGTFPKNGKCKECTDPNCDKCPENPTCEKCDEDSYLYEGECHFRCPDGTYVMDEKECDKCKDTSCKRCDEAPDECSECKTGEFRQNGTCVPKCDHDHYKDLLECKPCGTDCEECEDSETCTNCKEGTTLHNGECVPHCPAGYTEMPDGKCHKCEDTACETCGNPESCDVCVPPKTVQDGDCQTDCDPGYVKITVQVENEHGESEDRYECHKCKEDDCKVCDENRDCTECEPGFILHDEECISECPEGHFMNEETEKCEKCEEPCKECSDKDTCTKCEPPLKLSNGNCQMGCEIKEYYDTHKEECEPCNDECGACENKNTCTECVAPKVLRDGRCVKECKEGQVIVSGRCVPCRDYDGCIVCDPEDRGYCEKCRKDMVIFDGECLDECPDSTYMVPGENGLNDRCFRCGHACHACENKDTCTVCYDNYVLENGKCIGTCPSGKVYVNGKCTECISDSCDKCGKDLETCDECRGDYNLLNGDCFEECPYRFIARQRECIKCPCFCKTCDENEECLECVDGYFLDREAKKCVAVCPDGKYPNCETGVCEPCHEACETCVGPENDFCGSCNLGWFLDSDGCCNMTCVKDTHCPDGTVASDTKRECVECAGKHCKTCNKRRECQVCEEGYKVGAKHTCVKIDYFASIIGARRRYDLKDRYDEEFRRKNRFSLNSGANDIAVAAGEISFTFWFRRYTNRKLGEAIPIFRVRDRRLDLQNNPEHLESHTITVVLDTDNKICVKLLTPTEQSVETKVGDLSYETVGYHWVHITVQLSSVDHDSSLTAIVNGPGNNEETNLVAIPSEFDYSFVSMFTILRVNYLNKANCVKAESGFEIEDLRLYNVIIPQADRRKIYARNIYDHDPTCLDSKGPDCVSCRGGDRPVEGRCRPVFLPALASLLPLTHETPTEKRVAFIEDDIVLFSSPYYSLSAWIYVKEAAVGTLLELLYVVDEAKSCDLPFKNPANRIRSKSENAVIQINLDGNRFVVQVGDNEVPLRVTKGTRPVDAVGKWHLVTVDVNANSNNESVRIIVGEYNSETHGVDNVYNRIHDLAKANTVLNEKVVLRAEHFEGAVFDARIYVNGGADQTNSPLACADNCQECNEILQCVACKDGFKLTDDGVCTHEDGHHFYTLFEKESFYNEARRYPFTSFEGHDGNDWTLTFWYRKKIHSGTASSLNILRLKTERVNGDTVENEVLTINESVTGTPAYQSSFTAQYTDMVFVIRDSFAQKDQFKFYLFALVSKGGAITLKTRALGEDDWTTQSIGGNFNINNSKLIFGKNIEQYNLEGNFEIGLAVIHGDAFGDEQLNDIHTVGIHDCDPACEICDYRSGRCKACLIGNVKEDNTCPRYLFGYSRSYIYNVHERSEITDVEQYTDKIADIIERDVNSQAYNFVGFFRAFRNQFETNNRFFVLRLSNYDHPDVNLGKDLITLLLDTRGETPKYLLCFSNSENTHEVELQNIVPKAGVWIFVHAAIENGKAKFYVEEYDRDLVKAFEETGDVELDGETIALQDNSTFNALGVNSPTLNEEYRLVQGIISHFFVCINRGYSEDLMNKIRANFLPKPDSCDEHCQNCIETQCHKCKDNYYLTAEGTCTYNPKFLPSFQVIADSADFCRQRRVNINTNTVQVESTSLADQVRNSIVFYFTRSHSVKHEASHHPDQQLLAIDEVLSVWVYTTQTTSYVALKYDKDSTNNFVEEIEAVLDSDLTAEYETYLLILNIYGQHVALQIRNLDGSLVGEAVNKLDEVLDFNNISIYDENCLRFSEVYLFTGGNITEPLVEKLPRPAAHDRTLDCLNFNFKSGVCHRYGSTGNNSVGAQSYTLIGQNRIFNDDQVLSGRYSQHDLKLSKILLTSCEVYGQYLIRNYSISLWVQFDQIIGSGNKRNTNILTVANGFSDKGVPLYANVLRVLLRKESDNDRYRIRFRTTDRKRYNSEENKYYTRQTESRATSQLIGRWIFISATVDSESRTGSFIVKSQNVFNEEISNIQYEGVPEPLGDNAVFNFGSLQGLNPLIGNVRDAQFYTFARTDFSDISGQRFCQDVCKDNKCRADGTCTECKEGALRDGVCKPEDIKVSVVVPHNQFVRLLNTDDSYDKFQENKFTVGKRTDEQGGYHEVRGYVINAKIRNVSKQSSRILPLLELVRVYSGEGENNNQSILSVTTRNNDLFVRVFLIKAGEFTTKELYYEDFEFLEFFNNQNRHEWFNLVLTVNHVVSRERGEEGQEIVRNGRLTLTAKFESHHSGEVSLPYFQIRDFRVETANLNIGTDYLTLSNNFNEDLAGLDVNLVYQDVFFIGLTGNPQHSQINIGDVTKFSNKLQTEAENLEDIEYHALDVLATQIDYRVDIFLQEGCAKCGCQSRLHKLGKVNTSFVQCKKAKLNAKEEEGGDAEAGDELANTATTIGETPVIGGLLEEAPVDPNIVENEEEEEQYLFKIFGEDQESERSEEPVRQYHLENSRVVVNINVAHLIHETTENAPENGETVLFVITNRLSAAEEVAADYAESQALADKYTDLAILAAIYDHDTERITIFHRKCGGNAVVGFNLDSERQSVTVVYTHEIVEGHAQSSIAFVTDGITTSRSVNVSCSLEHINNNTLFYANEQFLNTFKVIGTQNNVLDIFHRNNNVSSGCGDHGCGLCVEQSEEYNCLTCQDGFYGIGGTCYSRNTDQ